MGKEIAPGPQEQRFAAYIEGLAEAAGHADRHLPLKNYCTGLLLPGERKSVEPWPHGLQATMFGACISRPVNLGLRSVFKCG